MVIAANKLALDALALVVAFGIGFLVWTFAHLFRESHPPREEPGNLFIVTRTQP